MNGQKLTANVDVKGVISMDTILQEISKEDALQRYLNGENIQILRPTQSGRLAMWSLNELFEGSRFLVQTSAEESSKLSIQQADDNEDVPNCKDLGLIDKLVEENPDIATNVSTNQHLQDQIIESYMTPAGDVHVETEDCQKKRKIRIDLGKLKSLKDAGWKRKDIAEELHCSLPTVNKYWNRV